jgi:hypothetical protein
MHIMQRSFLVKRAQILWGALVCILAMGLAFISCSTDSGGGYEPVVYESVKGSTTYKLELTKDTGKAAFTPGKGDKYTMTITTSPAAPKVSKGTVDKVEGSKFTLKHSSGGTFSVTASAAGMTNITGSIPLDSGEAPVTGPGDVTPQGNEPNPPTPSANPMAGTTWVANNRGNGWTYVGTLTFTDTTWSLVENVVDQGGAHTYNGYGTYTINGNILILTATSHNETYTATVSGNQFVWNDSTFIKQ